MSLGIENLILFLKKECLSSEKFQTLKLAHDTHRQEMNYHREAMSRVIQWTTSLYLAIGGGLVAIGPATWKSYGMSGKLFITAFIVIIAIFAITQVLHCADAINVNARIVVNVDKKLKFFDREFFEDNVSIYPTHWLNWGTSRGAGYYQWLNIVVTSLLAASLIIFSWII